MNADKNSPVSSARRTKGQCHLDCFGFQNFHWCYLLKQINSMTPFELEEEQLLVETHGQSKPAIGAALFYVKEFIQSV